jgi:hypothetical protein
MGEWKMPQLVFPLPPWWMGHPPPPHPHPGLFVHRPQVQRPPDPFNDNLRRFGQAVGNDGQQHQNQQHQAHMVENGLLKEEIDILKKKHEANLAKTQLEHDTGRRVLNEKIGTMEAEHGRAMGQHHNEWEAHHTASKQEMQNKIDELQRQLDVYLYDRDMKGSISMKKDLEYLRGVFKEYEIAHKNLMEAYREMTKHATLTQDSKETHKIVLVPWEQYDKLTRRIDSLFFAFAQRHSKHPTHT